MSKTTLDLGRYGNVVLRHFKAFTFPRNFPFLYRLFFAASYASTRSMIVFAFIFELDAIVQSMDLQKRQKRDQKARALKQSIVSIAQFLSSEAQNRL